MAAAHQDGWKREDEGGEVPPVTKNRMKLKRLAIQNIRSFGQKREFAFHDDFTILIGPNGGGKSNLLDVITVTLRQFFLRPWGLIHEQDASGPYLRFNSEDPFRNILTELSKFEGAVDPSVIELDWQISQQDVANMHSIVGRLQSILEHARKFRNGLNGLNFFERSRPDFVAGEILQYVIENGSIKSVSGAKGDYFLQFLHIFDKVCQIDGDENADLTTPFMHFPPYRAAAAQGLRISLAEQNRWNFELSYARTTSRQTMSLIQLATFHFASKMRRLESNARQHGFLTKFTEEPEVVQVTQTMQKLGYEWDLVLKDELNNTYEILLQREGKSFDITSASSGEKEIINFIFGIFALNVRNGLVIIDEPELHLHPKWQKTLYAVFEDLQVATGNQFVLATHSPAFITADTLAKLKRVTRIGGQSIVIPLDATTMVDRRELLQMINSHNNEKLFFADKVVLVEGIQDRLVFERILAELRKASGVSEMTAPEIIEVLEVFGKGNLAKYRRLLDSIQVPSFIIADRDYADEIGTNEVKVLFADNLEKVANNTLFNSKSVDKASLAQELHQAMQSKDWSRVENLWAYIVARQRSLKDNLTSDEQAIFEDFLAQQRDERIFLLSAGAIEEYLPDGWTSLDKTVELVSSGAFESEMSTKPKRFKELREICQAVIDYNAPASAAATV